MYYNSGIDKIKVLLNPLLLNEKQIKNIRPDNSLTLHKTKIFTLLAIHAEYFNFFFDYRTQIAKAIYELIEKKIIDFPNEYPVLTFMFIQQYIEYFIIHVSQVEFYFDFPKGKVFIEQDAVDNGDIKQYKDDDGNLTDTFYTKDNPKGKDTFCIYNRRGKLIKDNQIKHSEIENFYVERRIEARLDRENCSFLDINNFSGTYEDIFKRFKPFLAVLFYNKLFNHIEVKGKSNINYNRLVREAKKGKKQYVNRGRLKVSEPMEKLPDNKSDIQQCKDSILGKYYDEVENTNWLI